LVRSASACFIVDGDWRFPTITSTAQDTTTQISHIIARERIIWRKLLIAATGEDFELLRGGKS
jgi:hypothetical protein